MSGAVLSLLDRTSYDFSGLGQGTGTTVRVARNIDISRWSEGTLMVRVHAKTIAGGTIKVYLERVLPSAEDPSIEFVDTNPVASIQILGTEQENLLTAALPANCGAMMTLVVHGGQTVGDDNLKATISVVLSLKS
jgi:hypothetical protein